MMMLSSGSIGLTMRMMMMVGVDDVEDDERVHYLGNLLPRGRSQQRPKSEGRKTPDDPDGHLQQSW